MAMETINNYSKALGFILRIKKTAVIASLLFILAVGCKQEPPVQLEDLKWGDIYTESLVANHIDTTYLVSKNEAYKVFRTGTDTIGIIVYDTLGHPVYELKRQFMGTTIRYEYNRNGLVSAKTYLTDFLAQFRASYRFLRDSMIVYQDWTEDDTVTCIFRFDKKGKLVQSLEFENEDNGRGTLHKRTYEYDDHDRLISSSDSLLIEKDDLEHYERTYHRKLSMYNATQNYYTGHKPDSSIITYYFRDPAENYQSRTYFNAAGLRDKTILMDTLIIRYTHSRKALH